MRFQIRFPDGWKLQNQRDSVVGISEERDALIRLKLSGQDTASSALQDFFERSGAQRGRAWSGGVSGFDSRGSGFTLSQESGPLRGEVVCIEYGERVYRVVGVAAQSQWNPRRPEIVRSLTSFERVSDPNVLGVKPARIKIVRLDEPMRVDAFARRYGATVEPKTLAVINGVPEDATLQAGRSYKVVQGGELPP
jgi:predicted Zn-dependent protease